MALQHDGAVREGMSRTKKDRSQKDWLVKNNDVIPTRGIHEAVVELG